MSHFNKLQCSFNTLLHCLFSDYIAQISCKSSLLVLYKEAAANNASVAIYLEGKLPVCVKSCGHFMLTHPSNLVTKTH